MTFDEYGNIMFWLKTTELHKIMLNFIIMMKQYSKLHHRILSTALGVFIFLI